MITFFRDTINDFKKLHFPEKKVVYITTATVIVATFLVSIAITFSDFVISKIIGIIFGL